MMRRSTVGRVQMRPYYNLPSKSEHGRKMTGFLTPYRHWMWKQNELWRNVHEAQFEHLRKVYKRQWLESFRVNADEYIHKYNITKAAQLAQWEHEMQGQERKRRETQQMAQGRQALKKKHYDLLREFHERQFFYWYERASERLQYMTHINYVPQSSIQDHIDRELDKYVAGSRSPYPLNFSGQLPLLEDSEGNIVQVPANLMTNHATEHPDGSATMYQPPEATEVAEEQLLHMLASAQEEETLMPSEDSSALSSALDDLASEEEQRHDDVKVARSVEETDEDREIGRRAYIDRGKTGARAIFRRPKSQDDESGAKDTPSDTTTPMKRCKSKLDRVHALQQQQDAMLSRLSAKSLREGEVEKGVPKRGDVVQHTGRVRDRVVIPTIEDMKQNPLIAAGSALNTPVRTQDMLDRRYGRGKYKNKNDDDGEDL